MKTRQYLRYLLIFFGCIQISCEDFIEVDIPDDRITSETVFSKDETANSAVIGIYNQLFQSAFSSGFQTSITVLSGLSADNLMATVSTPNLLEFEQNEIFSGNGYNAGIWSSAYNIIYMANAVLQGLEGNAKISVDIKKKLIGEAKFLRAFTYFYLVNLYGDVPLVLTTDYQNNATIPRSAKMKVYNQIIQDLESAVALLDDSYDGERIRANKFTAMALLARVNLYLKNWNLAEQLSTQVIEASNIFALLPLDDVFLANSKEAIWQISPLAGGATEPVTNEGQFFIMQNNRANVALTDNLIASFDTIDSRLNKWIGSFDSEANRYYYPYKYKIKNGTGNPPEYSMVLRLAEQYLIRSEARAQQNKLSGAIEDLDKIRQRANLIPIAISLPTINQSALLDSIMTERRRELFTEWGHRWLDLKRTGEAKQILPAIKPLWQDSDVLYPIPQDELRKNPELTQNPGY